MQPQSAPQDRLTAIALVLRSDGEPSVVTVRSFLGWFHAQRRGYWIVREIRGALDQAGIRTDPDFESAFIDAEISFVLAGDEADSQPVESTQEVAEKLTVSDHAEVRVVTGAFADPTHRMSKLAAANRTPVSVRPDAP